MEIGALGSQPSTLGAQTADSQSVVSQASTVQLPRQIAAVLAQTLEETYEQDWLLGCIDLDADDDNDADDDVEVELPNESSFVYGELPDSDGTIDPTEICAISEEKLLLVDSGAASSLFKKGDFDARVGPETQAIRLKSISAKYYWS